MPTVLELSHEDRKHYLEAARHRPPPPELTPAEWNEREQLLERIRESAAILKTRFGVRHVVLFGSLAHTAWFTSDSDVDLAVEGLEGNAYWQAWRLLEELIADRPVDLVELETAGESLQQAIRRYGVEL
ncbi:DNA polymerase [Candidatus Poribacteria bacterium]|nr:DNA polymerase [Candidatus Poribacteria bacterium]